MLPNDIEKYQVWDKSNGQKLLPDLSLLLNEFSETDDKLARNYKNIDFDKFENYTIITHNNDIVSFSSILYRDLWPKNTVRIFNRLWRNKKFDWVNPTFGIISQLNYNHQVNYARDNGFDFVFISREKTPKHLTRWLKQANEFDGGWIYCEDKKRVCNGSPENCVQWVIYKKVSNTNETFPL